MGMKVNGTSGLTFPDTTTLASAGQASVRAWVNFNGTGTVAIRAGYNVTSITDNGTGQYRVNFSTAFPDTSYAATATAGQVSAGNANFASVDNPTTTSVAMRIMVSNTQAVVDTDLINLAVFR